MTKLKDFEEEKNNQSVRFIRKQIYIKKSKVQDFYNLYTFMEDKYLDFVNMRLNTANNIKELVKEYNEKREYIKKATQNG